MRENNTKSKPKRSPIRHVLTRTTSHVRMKLFDAKMQESRACSSFSAISSAFYLRTSNGNMIVWPAYVSGTLCQDAACLLVQISHHVLLLQAISRSSSLRAIRLGWYSNISAHRSVTLSPAAPLSSP